MQTCGFKNCNNKRTEGAPGVEIGYTVNNMIRRVIVCNDCGRKVMFAPRGTWEITKNCELKPIPAKRIFTL
jgi:DNA-directed RNA polymerase subunit RPC12/RpoP